MENVLPGSTVLFREWIGRYISATIWILYAIVGFTPKNRGFMIFLLIQLLFMRLDVQIARCLKSRHLSYT